MTIEPDMIEPPAPKARSMKSDGPSRRWRIRPMGLRSRILLTFGLGSLALSLFLALATFNFTRSNLVDERTGSAINQTYADASRLAVDLQSNPTNIQTVLERLGADRPLVYFRGTWTGNDARFSSSVIPPSLLNAVLQNRQPTTMRIEVENELVLAVGVPIDSADAIYFEFPSVDDVRSTLNSVNLALILAAGITTLLGVVLGAIAASRAVRPLTAASQAAQAIAGGRLDTRLAETEDPDLAVLTSSFNDMASALQLRVERDTRFTSDVSHELRSPLMTLAASVEVMQARRDEMPERAQAALDLLVADVSRFQGLVEDLLEISRFDAGGIRLNVDELLVGEFVRQAVAISSAPDTRILVAEIAEEMMIKGDRRRLARVVANLIDNGRAYGGGELEVSVFVPDDEDPPSQIWITVEDHGPGVPPDERDLIFERFARGSIAGRRSGSEGAGLGLALVDEHIKLHRGRVWVEDRLDGLDGACFIIELPAERV
ncbi:MAG: HAMP domain-containing protein [Actinobacteria bacterium]|nr:HAMP domain-containing protein [Actinomycetota bacterium]MSX14734.1 HAMP domain-containing protein [Actinomycetota bacterium]MSX35543.1 HAMP domain-containing protein [Actinomycetota bacterium]MSX76472.1 HAMP domain-containing protein [Actinomycetota bacterium]MSZ70870.1 HAMP domain-containing protein [Actinomycetota bacterium]